MLKDENFTGKLNQFMYYEQRQSISKEKIVEKVGKLVNMLTRMEHLRPRVAVEEFDFSGLPNGVIYEDFAEMLYTMHRGLTKQIHFLNDDIEIYEANSHLKKLEAQINRLTSEDKDLKDIINTQYPDFLT